MSKNGQAEALLKKLLDDVELRRRFAQEPLQVLNELGLDATLVGEVLPTDFNEEASDDPEVAERRSKSAWFGGNAFG